MRIVGGAARGRRLVSPPDGTRPTSDRAREGLFNTLASLLDLQGVDVLDLFAGTGAVGLEALSRGARSAVLVERARGAVAVIKRNLAGLDLPATVVPRTVDAYLAGPPTAFGFVFADPPYAHPDDRVAALLERLVTGGWLADDAIVVVERSVRGAAPGWPAGIVTLAERRYGDAVLWYGRRR